MSGLSLLFNSRGLATKTHFGQTWAHLAIFIPKWSVLNLWRIQQIFPSLAVTSVRNTAFQPLSIFPHSVHFWMKVGLFLLKDFLIVSVYLGHGNVKKEDISSELIEVSSNLFWHSCLLWKYVNHLLLVIWVFKIPLMVSLKAKPWL